MIAYDCPQCLRTLRVPEKYVGKRGKCKRCGASITIDVRIASPVQTTVADFSMDDYTKMNGELLTMAEQGRLAEVIRLLVKGANVNVRDLYGVTPLHLAVCNNHIDMARILITRGAIVNSTEHNGCTPLHCAAGRGFIEIAELLIANGGNVNAQDKDHETPLHSAARSTRSKESARNMVALLLLKGADIRARSKRGAFPLGEALEFGYSETAEYLRRNGARE